jgi:hypothetical protein
VFNELPKTKPIKAKIYPPKPFGEGGQTQTKPILYAYVAYKIVPSAVEGPVNNHLPTSTANKFAKNPFFP